MPKQKQGIIVTRTKDGGYDIHVPPGEHGYFNKELKDGSQFVYFPPNIANKVGKVVLAVFLVLTTLNFFINSP